ncbi:MAG: PQQ-dependent dehydrogenase, methanol/ethanol family [Pseudomonadota bacterium]|jgi:alcohol dehydrogenase (cytochrome c)|nr:PQQ-dependent dehydrogenase, methanol/ethanol family [Pseudomonadota bacterium]GIT21574.1 MAG: alcohol dehydrogenase [Gammaproteobacteria bacterium]
MIAVRKFRTLVVASLVTVVPVFVSAQATIDSYSNVTDARLINPEERNWLSYRGNLEGWGFSTLDEITTDNIANLEPVWTFSTGVLGGHESPPIVNDGVMFVTTPGNLLYAIDAASGDLLWRYQHDLPQTYIAFHRTNRGVALYGDKVYMATLDARVVALDAATGEKIWDTAVQDNYFGYYITTAPLAVDGKIMVGTSGGELGIRGFVVALDSETGEEAWRTYTVPGPGEPGNETWPGDSWRTGGAAVWIPGHYDAELGLAYFGTGNPGPWIGDQRPGDNLYTNSVIALDVENGDIRAHHQYHWNGSWDWDEVSTPILMPVERAGREFNALVHPGRNGYLWTLERQANRIGFVDAEPYVYQNAFLSIDPETGRPTYDADHTPATGEAVDFCPSLWGGKDWPPAAYNPETGLVYIPVNENHCGVIEGREVTYMPGSSYTGARTEFTLREPEGNIGEIQAWDMNAGEEVWSVEFQSHNWGGILTTSGNLIFSGGTSDRYFRAHDASNGDELWRFRTNSGIIGVPSTYSVDGKQYVAVQSGWGVDAAGMTARIDQVRGTRTFVPQGGVIWVFALPE